MEEYYTALELANVLCVGSTAMMQSTTHGCQVMDPKVRFWCTHTRAHATSHAPSPTPPASHTSQSTVPRECGARIACLRSTRRRDLVLPTKPNIQPRMFLWESTLLPKSWRATLCPSITTRRSASLSLSGKQSTQSGGVGLFPIGRRLEWQQSTLINQALLGTGKQERVRSAVYTQRERAHVKNKGTYRTMPEPSPQFQSSIPLSISSVLRLSN